MSVLSTDVAVPAPGSRRALRLAAAAATSSTQDPSTPFERPEQPLTRRELRLAREAALAAATATPAFDIVTAAQVVANASAAAPDEPAPPTVPLTRRALREAARAASASSSPAPIAQTSLAQTHDAEDASVENGFCADAVTAGTDLDHPVAERREVAEERELASVALTLSRLAVAATAFSANVESHMVALATPVALAEPEAMVTPVATGSSMTPESAEPSPSVEATLESEAPHAESTESRRAVEPGSQAAPSVVVDDAVRPRRRDLRQAGSGIPPVPPGGGIEETLPLPEPVPVSSRGASARHWVPRLAVLTALGAATVVTPVVAAASTATEAEQASAPVPLAAESALEMLVDSSDVVAAEATPAAESSTQASDQSGVDVAAGTASLLASDQLAHTRDTVMASRSTGRSELPQCGTPDQAVPNGALAALDSTEYVSLSMPVQEGVYRLTSQFGPRWGSTHAGTDFAAPAGTPIHAIADGKVIYAGAGKAGRSGMLVIVEHTIDGKKVESWYIHMYPDGVFVKAGDAVKVGDVIGEVGSYGNSTGPHLHLEIHTGDLEDTMGSAVDPLAWLKARSATPVTSSQVCA